MKVKLNDTIIECVNNYKILGVHIDKRLNFNCQIKNLKVKSDQNINILKAFSGPKRGANPTQIHHVFNASVMSKLIQK